MECCVVTSQRNRVEGGLKTSGQRVVVSTGDDVHGTSGSNSINMWWCFVVQVASWGGGGSLYQVYYVIPLYWFITVTHSPRPLLHIISTTGQMRIFELI